ncbi:MAG: hypothetical protein CTY16_06905 [Methylobacter sp.]|nr:MAG: hypothetical protein CTY16_06905 [Methylobacter sp.]
MFQPVFKHSVRAVSCAVLLFFSLSYPMTSFAALVLKAASGDQRVTLQWTSVEGATRYGVCYATETIADINNCPNYVGASWQATTQTTLKITSLTNGKKYYFRVLAGNAANTLAISMTITAIPSKTYTLNDTGITACANGANNKLPCPVAGFPNQDAESGRDVSQNNGGNGHAGFNFSKISGTGAILAANAKNWNCVKDNVTGLVWEVKTDDKGLHDKDWTYSWYEPGNSKNGGNAGTQNGGSCRGASACDTDAYIQAVNAAGWCGYKDWRLPSKAELHSIVDYSRYDPAVDTAYFPDTVTGLYWSSSPFSYDSGSAWYIDYSSGYGNWSFKFYDNSIRLVRSAQ